MPRIFVSHASADDIAVNDLADWLSARGFDHFVDHLHIDAGVSWDAVLRREASRADILILFVTEAWLASEECFAEYRSSYYGDRTVLPLLVQPLNLDELNDAQRKRFSTLCASVQGVLIRNLPPGGFEAEMITAAIVRVERAARVARRMMLLVRSAFAATVATGTLVVLAILFAEQVRGLFEAWSIDRYIELAENTGDAFFDCEEEGWNSICPEMVPLPGASYEIGPLSDDDFFATDGNTREVQITQFAVSRHEITRGQWQACVLSTRTERQFGQGCRELPFTEEASRRPVDSITWDDAQAYVAWLNNRLGQEGGPYRLLSEAEWEYAARGGVIPRTNYSWGDALGLMGTSPTWEVCRYANVLNPDITDAYDVNRRSIDCSQLRAIRKDTYQETSPVGQLESNEFGLYDTAGNVAEWVADCWQENPVASPNYIGENQDCDRLVKGGSWFGDIDRLRPSARGRLRADGFGFNIGMRIARDLVP